MRAGAIAAVAASCALGAQAPAGAVAGLAEQLVAKAQGAQLAQSETWLKMGRYARSPIAPFAGYRSTIVSDTYFLSPEGSTSPEAELTATVRALVADEVEESILCRFPARALWLAHELDHDFGDPLAECPDYRAWTHDGAVNGVSVVLVAGYMSNPGSVYGHLLLRFHAEGSSQPDDLLQTSINYGAAASEDDPLIPYILKGVFGGYRSTFTDLDYFHHNNRYRDDQLRDMWEYRLALTPFETALLVAHTWEVLGQENRYFFFRQNCAYRVGEHLELVVDHPLVPHDKLWVTPLDIFHNLTAEGTVGANDPVASVRRLPSRQSVFRAGYASLSEDARQSVRETINDASDEVSLAAPGATEADLASVLDVLLDYYMFAEDAGVEPAREVRARKHDLVLARMSLDAAPAGAERVAPDARARAPHQGQQPSMAQLAAVYSETRGGGVELHLRPVYYDFLSSTAGAVPYSELAMADLRLIQFDGDLVLRRLDLVRIAALNVSPTGAPGDGGLAWTFRVGMEDRDVACDGCQAGFVQSGLGKAALIGQSTAVFGLVEGKLAGFDTVESNVELAVSAGVLSDRGTWRALLIGGTAKQLDGEQETLPFIRAEGRFGVDPRRDIRFGLDYREAVEARAGLSFYW